MVERLFLAVLRGCLQFVIVVFPDHTHLLFLSAFFRFEEHVISIFHECAARVKMLTFSPNEMKYIWYSPQKSKFSFYFILNGKSRKHNLTFPLVVSSSM